MKSMRVWLLVAATGVNALPAALAAEDLFQAIRNNKLAVLLSALDAGSDANQRTERGTTLLMHAAAFGSLEAMRALADHGAQVNLKNGFDASALMWCAGDPAKVRFLVEHGADVNARSKQGRTPLIIAAAHDGAAASVKLLLDRGADVRAADALGITALENSAAVGDEASARLLIARGADIDAADEAGYTPLAMAATTERAGLVKLLLAKGAKVDAANKFSGEVKFGLIALREMTPLMWAVPMGSPEMAGALLDAGAKVNARDVRGMTPLMLAVASETQDQFVIARLIKAGADVNAKSEVGETPLDWAMKFGHPGTIEMLRAAGAKPGAAYSAPKVDRERPLDARAAVTRGVGVVQRGADEFFRQSGCLGCHHQGAAAFAAGTARTLGMKIDEASLNQIFGAVKFGLGGMAEPFLQRLDLPGTTDSLTYNTLGVAAAGYQPDAATDVVVHNVAARQNADGSWFSAGFSRAPMEAGVIGRTARSLRTLQIFGMPGRKAEFDERIARAGAWLETAPVKTTDDMAWRLLGLKWSGATDAVVRHAAAELKAAQHDDGGWSANRYLASDAYATGEALYALHQTGTLSVSDTGYERGARYLMGTQFASGAWHVRSRAVKFQPYFQSGFPFDHDQWISSMATAWATAALAPVAERQAAAELR